MGVTHVTAQVFNLARTNRPYEGEFLIDTGSIDCMAPGEALEKIGIQKEGRCVYELASGDTVEYERGFARIALMGQETVVQIIFGPVGIEPILGVVALENMGFVVDPGSNRLKRVAALPLK
uniref:Clan AA aspartic protease, AF_0612 family n=1 Tax=Candidatus Kentrum sp. FM TaxID=2126340 RepID=A0A450VQY8_9GAMM|nr:MAG: clan AA aspartic protease, AF_0612 family [Candidatus Kentron sp. FM]VFJ55077.1 MAG: clan AA aspartic protease, AF_0612 family [Candidatus Kentron sp. FM]VFK07186.1 MAG: clan AA aspartic protease, AF_0612 family [Candidatus Kentron sp. FM]